MIRRNVPCPRRGRPVRPVADYPRQPTPAAAPRSPLSRHRASTRNSSQLKSRRSRTPAPVGTSDRRLSATKSRTASTCSRVTSNCSMTASTLRSSRFSMTVATGNRVPLNTHEPPTLSGTLSTAGHLASQAQPCATSCTSQLTGLRRQRHAVSGRASNSVNPSEPTHGLVPLANVWLTRHPADTAQSNSYSAG